MSGRESRVVFRTVKKLRETEGRFSSKRIQSDCCLDHVSYGTVRRLLNEGGYHFLQARKKGLMSHADMRNRVKFARTMLRNHDDNIWTEGIAFYLDATSFVHKYNPADQARAPFQVVSEHVLRNIRRVFRTCR